MEGYDLIGKTGTAQIANGKTGKYYQGKHDYITSFAGMYPKDDPKVIVYVAMQRSKDSSVLPDTVKQIVRDTAKYLGVFKDAPEENKEVASYKIENYKGKTISDVRTSLDSVGANYSVFGNGSKIIDQYPSSGINYNTKERLLLFTNDSNVTMPDLTNYSVKEASVILSKLGIKYVNNATGYVTSQSISPGTTMNSDMEVTLN